MQQREEKPQGAGWKLLARVKSATLMMAMDLARRCGATGLEDRARRELLATGARVLPAHVP